MILLYQLCAKIRNAIIFIIKKNYQCSALLNKLKLKQFRTVGLQQQLN